MMNLFGFQRLFIPKPIAARGGDPANPRGAAGGRRRRQTPRAEKLEERALLTAANPADPAALRIDAGGSAYHDTAGDVWSADTGAGGAANYANFQAVDTPDPKLFTTFRTGNFTYHLSAPAGSYALELLFADPYDNPGQRVFDITANGTPLLTRLDIAATVGRGTAMIQTLPVTFKGSLTLGFTGVVGSPLLSALALYPAVPTPTTAATFTILPLGDSITYGSTNGAYPSGGYRSRLYQDFAAKNQPMRYLGSVYDTWSPLLQASAQGWFEGHGGYTIDQISANFDGVGTGTQASPNDGGHWINGAGVRPAIYPYVILLEAGTNDILEGHTGAQAASDMDALINKITAERPYATLFVAAITPLVNPSQNVQVKSFNSLLQSTVVPKYQKLGRHVVLVNQYNNFINASGAVEASHFGDGVHPDRAGYDKMGDTWYAAIEQYE